MLRLYVRILFDAAECRYPQAFFISNSAVNKTLRLRRRARLRLRPLFRGSGLLRPISRRRICYRRRRSRILLVLCPRGWRQFFLDRLAREHLVALRGHINK